MILFDDGRLLVAVKPAGTLTEDFAASHGAKPIHRIDQGTSGLLLMARDARTVQRVHKQLAAGTVQRHYLLLAHGKVTTGRQESHLVRDRGDGLRGSTNTPGEGKHSVTLVEVWEASERASLCQATLLSGRTHQVRIHLAESGHPLVGERVYIRDFLAQGQVPLEAPRAMLHAWRLRLEHPATHLPMEWEAPPPEDFLEAARALGLDGALARGLVGAAAKW